MAFSDSKNLRIFVNQLEVSQYFKNIEVPDDTPEWDTTCFNQPAETWQPGALRPGNTVKLSGGYYAQSTLVPLDAIAKAGQKTQMLATVCPDGCGTVGATGLMIAPGAQQIVGWGHNLQEPAAAKQLVGISFDIKSQAPGVLRGSVLHNPDSPDVFWRASTPFTLGDYVFPKVDNAHFYQVTTAGTSGASEPTWPTSGGTVTNGGVVFTDMGLIPWIDLGATYSGKWAAGLHAVFLAGAGTYRMQIFHSTNHSTWVELTHADFTTIGAAQILGSGTVNRYVRWGGASQAGADFRFNVLPFFDTYS